MLMYDDGFCRNYVNLAASFDFPGIDGGVADATQCGALAAADQRCNPNFVMVKTEAPFNWCYCAAAGDMCTSRATNPILGIFVPQALGGSEFFRAGRFEIQNGPTHDPELADSRVHRGGSGGGPDGSIRGGGPGGCPMYFGIGRSTIQSGPVHGPIQHGPTRDPEWTESGSRVGESQSGVERFMM